MTKFAALMAMTSSGTALAGPANIYDAAVTGCVLSVMFLMTTLARGSRRRGIAVVAD